MISDQILQGKADLMIAELIETKVQELRPGLCAINPDQPVQYGASGEFGRVYDQFVK